MYYLKPPHANAPKPTAMVRQKVVPIGDNQNAAPNMNVVWARKPPQFNNLRTWVTVIICLLMKKSAIWPQNWSIIPITRYGKADINPVLVNSNCSTSEMLLLHTNIALNGSLIIQFPETATIDLLTNIDVSY